MKINFLILFSFILITLSCNRQRLTPEQSRADSLQKKAAFRDKLIKEALEKRKADSIKLINENNFKYLELQSAINYLNTNIKIKHHSEIADLQSIINEFNYYAKLANGSINNKIDSISSSAKALKKTLQITQKKMFPEFRKSYIEYADRLMWESDIDVVGSNKTITFIGGIFVSNKNIKVFHDQVSDVLTIFRFTKVQYKWYKGVDEFSYYTLHSASDEEILE